MDAGYGAGVTLYLRDQTPTPASARSGCTSRPRACLPPATSADQSAVDVGGCRGGSPPTVRSSEWIDGWPVPIARRAWARARRAPRDRDLDRRGRARRMSCRMSRRRTAGIAAGVAMGFALGATLTLAIQGWANLPDPGPSAEPPAVPTTEPQPPEALPGLDLRRHARRVPSRRRAPRRDPAFGGGRERQHVARTDRGRSRARWSTTRSPGFAIPLEVAAVDPEELRAVPAARGPIRRARARRRPGDPRREQRAAAGLGPGRC